MPIADSDPHAVPAAPRPRLVRLLEDESAVPATETGYRRMVTPALQRGLALGRLALTGAKASPLLASFIGCVLVPSFAATVYFAFIATSQLAAEARFAVRQVSSDSREATPISGSGSGSGSAGAESSGAGVNNFSFSLVGQDAQIVTSYIRSRAIIDDLNAKVNLRELFRRPEADFWARLKRDASIEELTDYWNSMINTYIDTVSGIVTLKVRAFRAEDAVALANAVLQLSESLVNRISDRARRDATQTAEGEVRRAYEMTQTALADLRRFRDSAGIIDPQQAASEIGKLLIPLMADKIRMESDLFVATRDLDESAPTVVALKRRIATAEQQITDLKNKLTGTNGGERTVAASLAKFEELDLQREFAEKMYTLAQADLDRAQERAARQSVYLTVFVPPSMPEESRYPKRVAFPILIFFGLLIGWAIVAMTLASVEDHRL